MDELDLQTQQNTSVLDLRMQYLPAFIDLSSIFGQLAPLLLGVHTQSESAVFREES